jgi:hypothetical protein
METGHWRLERTRNPVFEVNRPKFWLRVSHIISVRSLGKKRHRPKYQRNAVFGIVYTRC